MYAKGYHNQSGYPQNKGKNNLKAGVCAYCRISSDSDEQQESFSAQITHYTELITANDSWMFAGIYADEGISGTSKDKRDDFVRLMRTVKPKKSIWSSPNPFPGLQEIPVTALKQSEH